jgi:hypothetical protein
MNIEKKVYIYLLVVCLIAGCAGVGKFTPQGGAQASNAVAIAQGLLWTLDSFYGGLVALKLIPDYTQAATQALAIADAAAVALRAIIAGATVTDEQLNVIAGQVAGAGAILKQAL